MAELKMHASPILTGHGKSMFTEAEDNNYYVCQYRDDVYRNPADPNGNSFIVFCKRFEKEINEDRVKHGKAPLSEPKNEEVKKKKNI